MTPPEPELTLLQEAALELRELFISYVGAGFSEHQACLIIATYLAQSSTGKNETHE